MKLVVGLGNPGKEYERTRHNTGFMFLEYLEEKYNFKIDKMDKNALIGTVNIGKEKVIFVKPQTFMNLSGEAVQRLKAFYKLENSDIIIIYDDIDLEFGKVRYRESGSAGTHNGMKNIVSLCSGENIPRIRIGIGKPENKSIPLVDYVLSKFSKDQLEKINDSFAIAEDMLNKYFNKQIIAPRK
ncbi:MAG: aminoacyl-tRNA hydrolase [Clostridia bacterium]|nr:aminoacyl-tRNA hydrolase [Clostridia bacterium]